MAAVKRYLCVLGQETDYTSLYEGTREEIASALSDLAAEMSYDLSVTDLFEGAKFYEVKPATGTVTIGTNVEIS